MTFRFLVALMAAVIVSPSSTVLAIGDPALVVSDLPGYVHVTSKLDGDITGETLLQVTDSTVDAVSTDTARSHTGQGRSWRSSDGSMVALVWVLDAGTEGAAADLAVGLIFGAEHRGIPFDSGISGTAGVSLDSEAGHVSSVFWREGSHIAAMSVSGPDATRSAADVTLLARLEAQTLQHAIGGERTTFEPPEGKSNASKPTRHSDLRWMVIATLAMVVATGVAVVVLANRYRRPPLPPLPPGPHQTRSPQPAAPASVVESTA